MPKQVLIPSPWVQEEEPKVSIGDTKLLDAKVQKPQSIDIVVYQDA